MDKIKRAMRLRAKVMSLSESTRRAENATVAKSARRNAKQKYADDLELLKYMESHPEEVETLILAEARKAAAIEREKEHYMPRQLDVDYTPRASVGPRGRRPQLPRAAPPVVRGHYEGLKKDGLLALAAARGIAVSKAATIPVIKSLLEQHDKAQAAAAVAEPRLPIEPLEYETAVEE